MTAKVIGFSEWRELESKRNKEFGKEVTMSYYFLKKIQNIN